MFENKPTIYNINKQHRKNLYCVKSGRSRETISDHTKLITLHTFKDNYYVITATFIKAAVVQMVNKFKKM